MPLKKDVKLSFTILVFVGDREHGAGTERSEPAKGKHGKRNASLYPFRSL
jgi:hypothetical protein